MADLKLQPQVAVLGGGAWGTALACVLAQQHASVTLWANEVETVSAINQSRENHQFLPEIRLPAAIRATDNLADLANADIILMVVPAQFARPVLAQLAQHNKNAVLVLCAKGIE
ncbi:MAG TPA: glycerol-3-phosphate dehydrogenase, partial [Rhodobiaceae bacterium]|nr:glycerol-3-phosphate dehydrogenase [Rhodobiaceae bacterium]